MGSVHPEFPKYYESKRLNMRSYQPGDGKWYFAMSLRNHEHLRQFESENVAYNLASVEAAEALIQDLANEWEKQSCFFIGAFDKKTGEFVAQVYIGVVDWMLPEFQIGYFVDIAHEGKGYVTEAVKATLQILFDQLNAHRVWLACNETNLRSIGVAERCKMTREGRLRENKRNPDGTYSSSLIYGLLRSEYQVD
jgi:RimJ/RimL family protein N-acetyltransferase